MPFNSNIIDIHLIEVVQLIHHITAIGINIRFQFWDSYKAYLRLVRKFDNWPRFNGWDNEQARVKWWEVINEVYIWWGCSSVVIW